MNIVKEFTELLKGTRPIKDSEGNIIIQKIMNMSLVCLTTDDEYSLDDRFENPLSSLKASNTTYGEIKLNNQTSKDTITPAQIAVMTKEHAQNHGMVKAGYVSANSIIKFNDAGCVQGSQAGYININSAQEIRMMPVTMREMLFEKIGNTSGHGNIYPAIRRLGQDTQSNAGEYLDKYFNKYDKKLNEFISHFELLDKTIGIIVLIDDEIVSIDKYPSFTYTRQVWNLLIRDCYGALAIIEELNNSKSKNLFTETLSNTHRKSNESVLDKLERALNKTKKNMTKTVEEKIENLFDLALETQLDNIGNSSNINEPKSYLLKNEGYIGQLITENNYHHLVSIVKKDKFDPSALRKVNEMKRKARNQERFSL